MLHHRSVGWEFRVNNATLCLHILFRHFFFFTKTLEMFIIFIYFYDKLSNFRKIILTIEALELVTRNCQWTCMSSTNMLWQRSCYEWLLLDFKFSEVSYMIQKRSCSSMPTLNRYFYGMVKISLITINCMNIFTIYKSLFSNVINLQTILQNKTKVLEASRMFRVYLSRDVRCINCAKLIWTWLLAELIKVLRWNWSTCPNKNFL